MSSALLSSKVFKPIPPMKGSFPLDHDNICKERMMQYMNCLKRSKYNGESCRQEIKDYLGCRMDNDLMAKESWESLGFKDSDEKKENSS